MDMDPLAHLLIALAGLLGIWAVGCVVFALVMVVRDALADRRWRRSPIALKLAVLERLSCHRIYEEPDALGEAVEREVSG